MFFLVIMTSVAGCSSEPQGGRYVGKSKKGASKSPRIRGEKGGEENRPLQHKIQTTNSSRGLRTIPKPPACEGRFNLFVMYVSVVGVHELMYVVD